MFWLALLIGFLVAGWPGLFVALLLMLVFASIDD